MDKALAKVGQKYHFLTIKKVMGRENGHIMLLIRCKCGKEFTRLNGHEFKSKSCGCERGLPVGEKASKATLKNYEVVSIRELYSSGLYSLDQLSEMFHKEKGYISRILKRQIWKHL